MLSLQLYICEPKLETLCGIIGIWAKNKSGESEFEKMPKALEVLSHRGPDNQSIKTHSKVCLAHARLSIIDTSEVANQPMSDPTGRYTLVFNGEIYNYRQLRSDLEMMGDKFITQSDTEVVLHMLIRYGENALNRLNGFFAFIFYDTQKEEVLFGRDRMGIKPLIIYEDDSKIILTSELHTLFQFDIDKTLNETPLNLYFRLTYIPAPTEILKRSFKILAGRMGKINAEGMTMWRYYSVKRQPRAKLDFVSTSDELRSRLNIAVKERLVADVPVGTFLSGGLDSSIISAIAKRYKDDLQTFSIGFDHKYFNESQYSQLAAKHIGSSHHEFMIGKKEFEDHFDDFLDSIDEPFGDSSSFAVYFLAKQTRQHVTVALSGDGADELFGGYRKQMAEYSLRQLSKVKKASVQNLSKLMKGVPSSRSNRVGDFKRKIQKFNTGLKLPNEKRYFEWCCFVPEKEVHALLKPKFQTETEWKGIKIHDMEDYLIADQHMILPNDMLKKVDLMSMAHSLEVRTPFLDHSVVELANSIPIEHKIKGNSGKLILKHAYKEYLPREILHRSKQGFEIPIQEWLGGRITNIMNSEMFSEAFIEEQNLFNPDYVKNLIESINRSNFGDKIYLIWSLIIFQHWYKKYYT